MRPPLLILFYSFLSAVLSSEIKSDTRFEDENSELLRKSPINFDDYDDEDYIFPVIEDDTTELDEVHVLSSKEFHEFQNKETDRKQIQEVDEELNESKLVIGEDLTVEIPETKPESTTEIAFVFDEPEEQPLDSYYFGLDGYEAIVSFDKNAKFVATQGQIIQSPRIVSQITNEGQSLGLFVNDLYLIDSKDTAKILAACHKYIYDFQSLAQFDFMMIPEQRSISVFEKMTEDFGIRLIKSLQKNP